MEHEALFGGKEFSKDTRFNGFLSIRVPIFLIGLLPLTNSSGVPNFLLGKMI